nr:RE30084p [Drosophila melanogaster]
MIHSPLLQFWLNYYIYRLIKSGNFLDHNKISKYIQTFTMIEFPGKLQILLQNNQFT